MLVVMYQDHCFAVTKQSEDFGHSILKRAGHAPLTTHKNGDLLDQGLYKVVSLTKIQLAFAR